MRPSCRSVVILCLRCKSPPTPTTQPLNTGASTACCHPTLALPLATNPSHPLTVPHRLQTKQSTAGDVRLGQALWLGARHLEGRPAAPRPAAAAGGRLCVQRCWRPGGWRAGGHGSSSSRAGRGASGGGSWRPRHGHGRPRCPSPHAAAPAARLPPAAAPAAAGAAAGHARPGARLCPPLRRCCKRCNTGLP